MTRTPRTGAPLLRRLTLGLTATAATVGLTLVAPTSASAQTPSTSSSAIATSANHALTALKRWEQSSRPGDYSEFAAARRVVARATAAEMNVSPELLESAWAMTAPNNQHVLLSAMSQLGVPYRSRMSEEGRGFDCSGLALYAYAQAGIELPRSSGQQIKAGEAIEPEQAEPGDLVYYPGHMSIYAGAGLIVHSPQSGKTVEVRPLFERGLRYGDATPDEVPTASGAAPRG
jgi:cell wall-associated NlpC family hydrolase